jgi:plastocyanin
MTSLWRICSSALTLMVACAAGATVSGSVRLRDSKDPAVRKHMDYSGVVVWLERVNGPRPVPVAIKHARMLQKDKTFVPHILAIPVGSTVDFPNLDPIFHNAFSNYNGQIFDVGLYPPGTSRTVHFSRPGIVRVFCNIHANMSAVIAVVDTPWYDVTAHDGSFKFDQVPPGEYAVHVYHERATAATLDALTSRFTVRDEPVTLPPFAISESGYLSIPHKNKYGHDYPPPPDAAGSYPAVR